MAWPAAAADNTASMETVVRMTGTYSLGAKAALEWARAYAKQLNLTSIRVNPGLDPEDYDVVAEGRESARKLRVQVRGKGNAAGLEQLLAGQADIWMAARQIVPNDLEKLRDTKLVNIPPLDAFTAVGTEHVVALSALAILVHPRNPVPALSTQQIREVFIGKYTSWAQLGGASNTPIGLASMDASSDDAIRFCRGFFGTDNTEACVAAMPRMVVGRFSIPEELADAVAGTPAGIGFSGAEFRRNARVLPLATECGTTADPTAFKIKAEEYPLTQRRYIYTAPDRKLPADIADFVAMIVGSTGQDAVAAAGLSDLSVGVSDEDYGALRLDSARDALDGGKTKIRIPTFRALEGVMAESDRLSLTFRFQRGSNILDSRGEADLGRLVQVLKDDRYARRKATLIGFSSAAGDYDVNRDLSLERANALRQRLIALGLNGIDAIGVGPAAPVACNLDAASSALNQRVEIWLRREE